MLCAPQVPAAACTPKMRAVYYALDLPFGRLERACVDLDAVTAISFMRQSSRSHRSSKSSDIKSKPVFVTRVPTPARILRVLVHRARHVLSAPTRVRCLFILYPDVEWLFDHSFLFSLYLFLYLFLNLFVTSTNNSTVLLVCQSMSRTK